MTNTVEVLDSIMGSGKSTGILKWCEENNTESFMYITPLLSESEIRVVEACDKAKFIAPMSDGVETKGDNLLELLNSGVNVSVTHKMYSSLGRDHLKAMKANEYTLIIDEEVSFIEPLGDGYNVQDFKYLKKLGQITTDENGKVIWMDDKIGTKTKYSKLANMCRLGMVHHAKRSEEFLVTQLPMDLIAYAKRVILLTYLFEGSILESFLRLKNVDIVPFTEVKLKEVSKKDISKLIEFVGENHAYDWSAESLSTNWYNKATQKSLTKLAKVIRSVGKSQHCTVKDFLWTLPKSVAKPERSNARKVAPVSYAAGTGDIVDGVAQGCYLFCASRATNAYKDRSVMMHCYNRYPHLSVSTFLQDYGCEVDMNKFALSEMLQWIWRSRIRNGEPIKVCILSKRMRKIFKDWLEEGIVG